MVVTEYLLRGLLDLAAVGAAAGVPRAERTRAWGWIATVEPHLHDRLLAAHRGLRGDPATAWRHGRRCGGRHVERAGVVVPPVSQEAPGPLDD
ncbi:hypothetical protein [Streptomyces mexicanus]|uniref:hypothetical protein n=1 Tax=Streptomyces mexicanus TaxID=178566 RepID=UPI0036B7A296